MPSVSRILQLAPVSCYLSANDVAKGNLFGGKIDPSNPLKIYNVYKVLKVIFDKDPTYTGLQVRADYLYELLKKYALRAAAIVDGNSGGSVAPPTPPTVVDPEIFVVSASSFMVTGQSSKTLTDFIGYNLLFTRNGIPQSTVNTEFSYYSWDKDSGLFNCTPALSEGELIGLYPL